MKRINLEKRNNNKKKWKNRRNSMLNYRRSYNQQMKQENWHKKGKRKTRPD